MTYDRVRITYRADNGQELSLEFPAGLRQPSVLPMRTLKGAHVEFHHTETVTLTKKKPSKQREAVSYLPLRVI